MESFYLKISKENRYSFTLDINHKLKINLGDTIFLIPLIDLLIKSNIEFNVNCDSKQLEVIRLFNIDINQYLIQNTQDEKNEIVITSINLFSLKDYFFKKIIYFDCTSPHVNNYVAEYLCNYFNKKYKILENYKFSLSFISFNSIYKKDQRYVLYSEEVFSGFHRITKKKIILIHNLVQQYYEMGFRIIRIGNKNIKYKVYEKFEFDVFSTTNSIKNFFNLLNSENCHRLIAFDTFPAHLSTLINKETHIIFRNFNKRYEQRLKSFYFPSINNRAKIKHVTYN